MIRKILLALVLAGALGCGRWLRADRGGAYQVVAAPGGAAQAGLRSARKEVLQHARAVLSVAH